MTEISPDRSISLDDYFVTSSVHFVDMGVFAGIWPLAGETNDELIARIYPLVHEKNPNMEIFTKDTMPPRWHWSNNRRIAPLNIVAKNGWWLHTHSSGTINRVGGAHGYDNSAVDMTAIVVASGPAFRNDGKMLDLILNIDIYEMISSILDITPAPNNGSLARISSVFAAGDDDDEL